MSNIFSGGSHDLDLSNGATAVFIDVLTLAVSDLASEDWDFRFAALLTLQDQNVMGRGATGFDLAEFDWVRRSGNAPARRTSCRVPQHSRRADIAGASWPTTRLACMTTCTTSRPSLHPLTVEPSHAHNPVPADWQAPRAPDRPRVAGPPGTPART
ncbi:hypothetical protein ABZ070_36955 [Streptomyces sp. NPDC006283]|uniref:hypothetical protein n=1 Tax=Streptomyces sp. NPDC006283 TaxID=3156741 RepID=UPI0033BD3B20